MQHKNIIERTFRIAQPFVEQKGLYIWDIEFEKEGPAYTLTIYLDGPTEVSINDCEEISRAVDPILDEENFIDYQYTFCVSSAGLERKLTKPEHFEKMIGRNVEIHLFSSFEGQKIYVGALHKFENGDITIGSEDSELTFCKADISLCRLYFDMSSI